MSSLRPLSILVAFIAATAWAAPAPNDPIAFDGESYYPAGVEDDATRHAEHFIRDSDNLERFSRRLTIADQPKATSVKQLGLGVIQIAKLRTPGMDPETFSAEGAEDRDLTITWFALTDDGAAIEFHAARFVALFDKKQRPAGVREYHFVAREYLNGVPPDDKLAWFEPVVAGFSDDWIEQLQHLDRAPTGKKSGK